MLKQVFVVVTLASLLLCILPPLINGVVESEERTIRIVDAETGSPFVTIGDESTPVPPDGYRFAVNVTLEGATNFLHKYRISIAFDKSYVRCTGVRVPEADPAFVFSAETGPIMRTVAVYNDLGFAAGGAMLPSDYVIPDQEVPHYVNVSEGLLGQFTFVAINPGSSALTLVPTESLDYPPFDSFLLDKDKQNIDFAMEGFAVTILGAPILSATIDITPRMLNLKSRGKWIAAHIELPDGHDARNVDVSSILLNNTIAAAPYPVGFGDRDGDARPDVIVKFNRAHVIECILGSVDHHKKIMTVTLTISGRLQNGTMFNGSRAITVIASTCR